MASNPSERKTAGAAVRQRNPSSGRPNTGWFKSGNEFALKPGQSGNPGGYSARRRLTEALAEVMERTVDADPLKRTNAELLVQSLLNRAFKGDVRAHALIFERLEGKVPQPVAVGSDGVDGESMTDLRIVVVNTRDEAVALGAGPRSVRESGLEGGGDLPI